MSTRLSVRKPNPAASEVDKKVLGLPTPVTFALGGMVLSALFVPTSKNRPKNRENLLKYGLVGAVVGAGTGMLLDSRADKQ